MSFVNPLLLLGLIGVAVPIAVHLINRRRAVRRRFPALEFLIRSNERLAGALKLKQVLLLMLRISIFVLVPLALAQPYVQCGPTGVATTDDRMPSSVVFVVDASASMSAEQGGSDNWNAAVDAVEREVRRLRSWDQVAVIVAGPEPVWLVDEFTDSRNLAVSELDAFEPTFGRGDMTSALGAARELLTTSRLPRRRTVIVGDLAAHGFGSAAPDPSIAAGLGELSFIDVSAHDYNLAVTELGYREADQGNGAYDIVATIQGYGEGIPRNAEVSLEFDGRPVGVSEIELSESGAGTVSFLHRVSDNGPHSIVVRVGDGEGPVADDTRRVTMQLDREVQALLVNGDVRSVQYNDELFYLERALQASLEDSRSIRYQAVGAESFNEADLSSADVVVLANVASLAPSAVRRIQEFVESGGGLLISCGDNVDADRYNSLFAELLPKPIRSVKLLSERDDPDASIKATRLAMIDGTHPIFRVFDLPGGTSIQSVTAYSYVLLEPEASAGVRTLASFGDGGPALLEHTLGQGRVLLWTSTLDFDWTDLPIRSAYLPLVQRSLEYLARQGGSTGQEGVLGDRLSFDVESLQAERITLDTPSDERLVLEIVDGTVEFRPQEVGTYAVSATIGGADVRVPSLDFAVNAPLSEVDPGRIDPSLVEAMVQTALETTSTDVRDSGIPAGQRSIWPMVLLLVLLIIYAETLVAVRRKAWRSLRESLGKKSDEPIL